MGFAMDINKTTAEIRKKQNKRLDGWNVSLPYGIAKDLGLDVANKTPREVWDEIRKITKESPSDYYKRKAQKGEGVDIKIGDVDEDELHREYQKISARPSDDEEYEKFRERLNKKKDAWKKNAEKLSVKDIQNQIDDCEKKIKTYMKNPDRDGENLAYEIEHKVILNDELKRRPKE